MATHSMKPLSSDDRGTLMIRIVSHHLKSILNNRIAVADLLIDGYQGYDNMSDEELLEAARKLDVSTEGLDIVFFATPSPLSLGGGEPPPSPAEALAA